MTKKSIIATCYFNHKNIKGVIDFSEDLIENKVIIKGQLKSNKYKNSYHGFHIHEAGDLSDNCDGACSHFNPYNENHGDLNSHNSHLGDLGNIYFDNNGISNINITTHNIKLRGTKTNIIGRSIVIHLNKDDLGLGNVKDSLTTGNAGPRITCAVIGYSKKMFNKKTLKSNKTLQK